MRRRALLTGAAATAAVLLAGEPADAARLTTGPHMPLYLGQINDGIEPTYPTTDVPAMFPFVHGLLGVELDRNLSAQRPGGWWSHQVGSVGIAGCHALRFHAVRTVPLSTWQAVPENVAVVVRARYHGARLSLISCKRPAPAHAEHWPEWDGNLARLDAVERAAGRERAVGLDVQEASPTSLENLTGLTWHAPRPTAKVGFLLSRRLEHLTTTTLPGTGEHMPVVSVVRVRV